MTKELRVEIGSDAYASCFCHALSTEHEEIMGLLIGTFGSSTKSSDEVICKIFMSMVLIRSDKRKDRVEIPIETMAGVSARVDEIGKETGIPNLQVVGWYHSHPHITALPSHVDLGTQMNYQMLDANFVGLIFSVFNRDPKTQSASEQVCCFQSLNNQQRLIPFQVVPSPRLFFDDFIEPTSYFNGAGDDHREADRQSAVMKLATGAIATIFQLYVKEEHEAYNTIEAKFDDVDRDFTSPNFIRRVSNGAAFATAITKIVSVCHDSQVEAIEAKSRIAKARVAALELYRDTLKAKLAEKESKNI